MFDEQLITSNFLHDSLDATKQPNTVPEVLVASNSVDIQKNMLEYSIYHEHMVLVQDARGMEDHQEN